jgi:hypothetical protein
MNHIPEIQELEIQKLELALSQALDQFESAKLQEDPLEAIWLQTKAGQLSYQLMLARRQITPCPTSMTDSPQCWS